MCRTPFRFSQIPHSRSIEFSTGDNGAARDTYIQNPRLDTK